MRKRVFVGAALLLALALVASACGSDKKSNESGGTTTTASGGGTSGNTASAPGITKDSITVGFIDSETGVASANNKGAAAFKARMEAENDKGGVFGRKIKVVSEDDTSSPQGNITASQKIVQQSNPFAVVDVSAFTFAAYRYYIQQKIPMLSGGYDGPEYADPGNEWLLPVTGNIGPNFPPSTVIPQFMKDKGVTKGAGLGYGISPSSSASAKGFAQQALPAVGLGEGYVNTAIPFGGENVGPVILDMKKNGVDGAYLAMDNNTNYAIANTALQNDLKLKALVMATGFDRTLLEQPTTVATAEKANVFILTGYAPSETGNAGTKRMLAVLKKYTGATGDPTFGEFMGYATGQLFIDGLKKAGRNPTRASFVNAVRTFDKYTLDGMFCSSVSFTPETYGKTDPTKQVCSYFVKVENGKFVVAEKATGHALIPKS